MPTYKERWPNLNSWHRYRADSTVTASFHADDGGMGGRYARFSYHENLDIASDGGVFLLSRRLFKPGVPCSVSYKVRAQVEGGADGGNLTCHWNYFYTDEPEYDGLQWSPTVPSFFGMNGGGFTHGATGDAFEYGRTYLIRQEYDGDVGVKSYVDGILQPQLDMAAPFTVPFMAYLAFGMVGRDSYIDIGEVTFSGDMEGYGAVGRLFADWRGEFSALSGQEEHWGYQGHGGLTARPGVGVAGDVQAGAQGNVPVQKEGSTSFLPGAFDAHGPLWTPPTGRHFTSLKLWGAGRGGGTLRVYLRDARGALIPDSAVAGNSAGLACGWPATYDISGVAGFYIDAQGNNPSVSNPVVMGAVAAEYEDAEVGMIDVYLDLARTGDYFVFKNKTPDSADLNKYYNFDTADWADSIEAGCKRTFDSIDDAEGYASVTVATTASLEIAVIFYSTDGNIVAAPERLALDNTGAEVATEEAVTVGGVNILPMPGNFSPVKAFKDGETVTVVSGSGPISIPYELPSETDLTGKTLYFAASVEPGDRKPVITKRDVTEDLDPVTKTGTIELTATDTKLPESIITGELVLSDGSAMWLPVYRINIEIINPVVPK